MTAEFPAEDVLLGDGRSVHIRSMTRADEAELLQAFDRLTPEAKQMRFMRVVDQPNLERLRAALDSFPQNGQGIVATIPADDGIDIVGAAIFVIGSDPANCEFAMTVAGDHGGAGLGRALLTRLIDLATRRGLREMDGFVLSVNRPMLRLAERLGFTVSPDPDDYSVRICRLRLA
jgi:acetyltransferase